MCHSVEIRFKKVRLRSNFDFGVEGNFCVEQARDRAAGLGVLGRHPEAVGADSIVTTLYTVNGVAVTLIDRSSTRDEAKRDTSMGFTDQVAAKSRIAAPLNSITWSDSSGRTRTLRGAVPQSELERVKSMLFGAMP